MARSALILLQLALGAFVAASAAAERPLTTGELDGGSFERFSAGECIEVSWRARLTIASRASRNERLETSWATVSRPRLPVFAREADVLLTLPLAQDVLVNNNSLELAFSVLHGRWISEWMPAFTRNYMLDDTHLHALQLTLGHDQGAIVQLQWRPFYTTATPDNPPHRYQLKLKYRWGADSAHLFTRRLRWVVVIALVSAIASLLLEQRSNVESAQRVQPIVSKRLV